MGWELLLPPFCDCRLFRVEPYQACVCVHIWLNNLFVKFPGTLTSEASLLDSLISVASKHLNLPAVHCVLSLAAVEKGESGPGWHAWGGKKRQRERRYSKNSGKATLRGAAECGRE